MIFASNFKMLYSHFSLAVASHSEGCGLRTAT
jgi:hypothetical protein